MSLVGKGPLATSGPPKGPPPGAKIAIKGSGPPPGKVALPKPPLAGPAAATTPGSPAKASTGPGSGVLPSKPPLGAPAGGLVKPALPLEKKVLPKLPAPPAGTKTADSPPKALPLKSPTSPTKATLEKAPGALKQPAPGPPSPPGALKPAVPKPPLSAAKGLTSVPPDPPVKDGTANGISKAAKAAPSPNPSTASKGPPGTSLAPPNKPSGLPSSPKGPPDSPSIGKVPTALAAPAKESLGPTSSIATNKTPGPSPATAAPSAGLASTSSKLIHPSEAKPGKPANAGDGSEALSNVGSPGVDEFGRQRGSVGDLAPRSEITHDLLGNVIPVFDKA
ncbi:uncharacterized protein EMH_0046350 [Eimeria mitis]|uniref:Uncharacterized protein n=1 Tax=Eimeria mitis TaxID=44415 RepID=U6K1C1_9EIME|nr:uncharacterized protein EMH_0046350 [Eimeria mitis]CDJ30781.1 hypothetical protein, conserved [Eimeria mitis]